MDDPLSLTGFGLGFTGWFLTLLTRFIPMWTVSGSSDNTTDWVSLHWDGLWINWEQKGDGTLHCHFIQSALHLSGNFRTWRALIITSICIGFLANVIYVIGRLKLPTRRLVKVASGGMFLVSGVVLLIVASWVSNRTSESLASPIALRREWGMALYTAWIGTVVLAAGGGVLISTYSFSPKQPVGNVWSPPVTPGLMGRADPLSPPYLNDPSPYSPTTRPY